MKYLFLMQAFGDNVVSLSNVMRLNNSESIRIFGTGLTNDIVRNLSYDIKINKVFDDIPSFYNIRRDGILKSVKDFLFLIKYIKENIPIQSDILLEKKDFRFKILKALLRDYKLFAVDKELNIYIDRARFLGINSKIFQRKKIMDQNIDSILINPTGRSDTRHLSPKVMNAIIQNFKEYDLKIYLIDYLGFYKDFEKEVDFYYSKIKLNKAVDILKKVDLYCGPDSLFIHLAYVLDKNYFCIMNYDSSYFMPPAAIDNSHILVNKSNLNELKLKINNWLKATKENKIL